PPTDELPSDDLQIALDRAHERAPIVGLDDVPGGSATAHQRAELVLGAAGEEHQRTLRQLVLPRNLDELVSLQGWHHHVNRSEIRTLLAQQAAEAKRCLERDDLVAAFLQRHASEIQTHLAVIDDEDLSAPPTHAHRSSTLRVVSSTANK